MQDNKMDWKGCCFQGMRLGIFGKGGSGKSTLTVLLAHGLQQRGCQVVVLDADSTNVGLAQALGTDHAPVPLLDYFGGMVFSGGRVTCPVDDPAVLPGAEIQLEKLPEAYKVQNQAGITLLEAGKIGGLGPGAGCDGPVSKIARDLEIQINQDSPVLLIDFKAGFEDTARGVITTLDWALVVVDPTLAAVQMAVHLKDTVGKIRRGSLPALQHLESPELVAEAVRLYQNARLNGLFYILNKVPDEQTEQYLRVKLAEADIHPQGVVEVEPMMTQAWLQGKALIMNRAYLQVQDFIDQMALLQEYFQQEGSLRGEKV